MTFTQVTFLIFFPITVLAYYLIPQRFRYVWLLFCSYVFYFCQDAAMPLYLIACTVITYTAARFAGRKRLLPLWTGIILLIGGLAFFKYFAAQHFDMFMPIGISFFTFQSISYIIDVYRSDAECENNFLKVALFVSFFPAILSGPIQRGKSFMPQLLIPVSFDTQRIKNGLFYMLWGYFLKVAIAGRLSILTTQVIGGYMNYSGLILILAMIAYAFLIYCDFAGYSYIAIGAGMIFGFDLGINFRRPYLSGTIGEFWRRWHISLSGWFRDYVYIPLGGSRKGTIRKYLNVMIVFALSGIWHGNTVNFLVWGLLNGAYQVMGQILTPVKEGISAAVGLKKRPRLARGLAVVGSFLLLDFAWIFFATDKISDSINIISRIMSTVSLAPLTDGTLYRLGLGRLNLMIAVILVVVLIVTDVICEHFDCDIAGLLPRIPTFARWVMYYALISAVVLSVNLSSTEFIYARF